MMNIRKGESHMSTRQKVIRAEEMGFCMGVERAVSIVQKISDNNKQKKNVFTLGPIIHNRQIIENFSKKGVNVLQSVDDIEDGTVIIRAHGVPPSEKRKLEEKGIEIIDGTCPKVIASHKIIQKYSESGYRIVIVGDKNHGEILGLAGHAENYDIIENAVEAGKIKIPEKTMVISQTTINEKEFTQVCSVLTKINPKVKIFNSICSATKKRQTAVKNLADKAEAIIVIGGKNSANTIRLYNTVKEIGIPCWHIEDFYSLPKEINSYHTIGITAGASTPEWVISAVEEKLIKL